MAMVRYDSAAAEWRAYWPLVLTAMVGFILTAALGFSFGVMMPSIEKEFGWTRAQISTGPMLISLVGIILSTAAGYGIDRIGARKVGIAVAISMSAIIALMSTMTNSLWHWWLLWGIFAVIATATPTAWLAPVTSLFVKGRGLALAFTLTGTGIAGGLIPVFCQYFVEHYDWRTGYLALGLLLGAVTVPLALLFWRGAEEFSAKAERGDGGALPPPPETLPGMTVRQGFASANFYMLFAGSSISGVTAAAIIMNLVPILVSTGISAGEAAAAAGAYGVATIAGRFIGGGAMDRFGAKWVMVIATLVGATLPISLLLSPGAVWVAVAAVAINAFAGGVKAPAVVYLVTRYFGPRSFGTLYGTISISQALAVGIGPLIANHTFDVSGDYTPVLWIAIPAVLISTTLYALLGAHPEFTRREEKVP